MRVQGHTRIPLKGRQATGIILADGQKPFHDHRTWNLLLSFIRRWHPTFIINLGDDAECYHWSRYDKSPLDSPLPPTAAWNADAEIRSVQAEWLRLKKASPRSTRIYIEGNHEERVRLHPRQMTDPAVTTSDTFASKFAARLYWDHLIPYGYACKIGHLWFTHGHTTVEFPAKKMLKEWGSCVAFGHTHRIDSYIAPYKSGHVKGAWSIPCHCRLDPHFTPNPNWLHGFAYAQWAADGTFNLQPIPIIDYRFVFGNVLWKG